ncbi:canalicular multispecific organic anion transporter 1 [Colletotrichum navitas]|uniref:Canalicular multispecific organic anion transporter 1 n=1 Tax=Colletotrichum navitas TaxID=681940 RepID=A0AAD8UYJ1_9PEZI|nr:canalicular multispecific organic anion transporter 1 [Colletotrichum navitas]KAK1570181.1 canalicular multispecific organic anion transporter 1 [Colletotrichum navitas]
MECSIEADRVFGPAVQGCRSDFDFTLLFHDSILTILPSAVLIILASIQITILVYRPTFARLDRRYYSKLAVAFVSAALQLALLIQRCLTEDIKTAASVPAAVLGFAAACALCLLSPIEHRKSCRPSSLIMAYLFTAILTEVARARTYFLMGQTVGAAITTTDCLVKVLLAVLEGKKKVLDRYSDSKGPEDLAGPISQSFLLWLNSLFLTGYRRAFTARDMGMISSPLYTHSILYRFRSVAKGHIARSGNGFALQTFTSLGWHALAPVMPRLAVTGFTFAQSFLVTALLNYLENGKNRPASHGYGLLGACVFVYIGIAVSNSWYWRLTYKSVSIVRGGLVVAIFEKVLRLPEHDGIESKANTLMISDAQRIVSGLAFIHELWAGILETALATYLLQRIMGVSSMAMLGLALACGVLSSVVANKISLQQQKWLRAMEQRIKATKRLLDSLKAVKMRGAEDRVSEVVNELRRLEIRAARLFRALITASVFLSYSTVTLSPLLVFAAYIGIKGESSNLDSATMFSSLVLIALLGAPLIHLFQAMPALGAAQGCFMRIHAFLETPEGLQSTTSSVPNRKFHDSDSKALPATAGDGRNAISIRNVSLGWSPGNILLKDIHLEVKRGSVVALLGKTGSGKSLLLKSIIGEVKSILGIIDVSRENIAYCSQAPWLENMSAEQTWTQYGGQDTEWLAEVIDACFLDDLTSLPDYKTGYIGSGGVRLSGGQRQRLALARSIVLRKEVVLLDDVFSALDRTTRRQISTRLLGPRGLLRRLGTTVLFTAHDASITTLADEVYEISADGGLASIPIQKSTNSEKTEDHIDKLAHINDTDTDGKNRISSGAAATNGAQEIENVESKAEKLVSDRQVYIRYAQAMGFKNAGIFLFLVISFAVCLKLPDLWVQWWASALQQGDRRGNDYWIGMFAVLEVLPLLVLCVCVFHLMFCIVPTSASSLHASLLRTVLVAPFAFISRIDTGSLMNRFNQDLMFVDTMLPLDLFNTCAELFTSTFQLVLVAIVSKHALAVLPVISAVLYSIQRVYLRSSKQLRLLDLDSKADLHTKFGETASGLSVIRANGWTSSMREKFMEKLDRSQEPFHLLYMVQRWLQLVLNLVVGALAITVAGVAIGLRDKIAAGAVGVAFLNTTTLGETLTNFIISWTSLETSLGAISRLGMFERDTPSENHNQSDVDVPDEWPGLGEVKFENVWATYDNGDNASSWRLSGVTLTVQPGERIAVCGRTGSGKSTLFLALLGMLHVPVGSISVDGIDITDQNMALLRRRFQVVSQDSFFEPTSTFRQELDPSGGITDGEMESTLRGLCVWDVIATAGGLNSKRANAKISAGEAQLLSIARLLLQNHTGTGNIILLDEATSNLDQETEAHAETVMAARLQHATVISIMHRLEAVVAYDKIAVLDKGVLVDFGAVVDVMERCELFN